MQQSSLYTTYTTVVVVGLGKIGLPLAVQYASSGYRVLGCDCNAQVVASINAGIAHVQEEPELAEAVRQLVHNCQLVATQDTTAAVRYADAVVVIVPVLLTAERQADFSALDEATRAVGRGLQPGTLVIYETTLPVGTTRSRIARLLEETSGYSAGHDFYLAYSPERVSSGSVFRDLRTYPKVVGGLNIRCTVAAEAFYRAVLPAPVTTMASTDEAEFVKLIETTYRDVNIALANEYACYADMHGLNVMAAIAAANSQPYSHIHAPGVGVGGHCIPVYPYFLFANALDADEAATPEQALHLPRLARQVNDAMAVYAVQRLEEVLGSLQGVSVLLLGVAYRGDVRETAFSSALLLRAALERSGAQVYAHDPLYTAEELRALGYTPLASEDEGKITAMVLQAAHSIYLTFDFVRFEHCRVLLDGRHALDSERGRLEALGICYLAPGDGGGVGVHHAQFPCMPSDIEPGTAVWQALPDSVQARPAEACRQSVDMGELSG